MQETTSDPTLSPHSPTRVAFLSDLCALCGKILVLLAKTAKTAKTAKNAKKSRRQDNLTGNEISLSRTLPGA